MFPLQLLVKSNGIKVLSKDYFDRSNGIINKIYESTKDLSEARFIGISALT